MRAQDDVTVQRSQRHAPRRTSLRSRSMPLTGRALVRGALVAVLFLGAAPPGHAQRGPVASGGGAFVAPNQQDHLFGFSVFEVPGGSVRGRCSVIEPASSGVVAFDVTSAVQVGNVLLMAGPITSTFNAPPQFVVGATAFLAVEDNGDGSSMPDGITGTGVVPPFLGSLTAQEILALIGPPPPQAFSPLYAGGIRIY